MCRKLGVLIVLLALLVVVGCPQRGDLAISPVFKGNPAPHRGWNLGPDIWVEAGDPVPVSGVVFWLEGTDPNELFGGGD